MAFQIKDFTSIVASMINYIRGTNTQLTDFNVGSVNRTMIEAPAIEIDELYQQMFNGLQDAIPAAIYPPFGFDLLPASPASTNLTFSIGAPASAATIIPQGSPCTTVGGTIKYITQAQAVIPAGQTSVVALAIADTPGTVGNVSAATITAMLSPITGVSVTNTQAVISGRDLETDQARKLRFQGFITSLARSHLDGIQYGASTGTVLDSSGTIVELVQMVYADEAFATDNTKPLGYVDVYIWNGVDSASGALITSVTNILNGYFDSNGNRIIGYKGAGVIVNVHAVTEQYQNVTAALVLAPGVALPDVSSLVVSALAAYISSIPIGGSFEVSKATSLIMAIQGIADVTLTPNANVTVAPSVKLLSGTLTVT